MTELWTVDATFRVRYADTDKMGVMYYGRYMELYEVGRTEWIRQCWRPYVEIEREGTQLPVVHAYSTYLKSFRYDDLIRIRAFPLGYTNARIRFGYELYLGDDTETHALGITEHAFIDENGKLHRIPAGLSSRLQEKNVPNRLAKLEVVDWRVRFASSPVVDNKS